MSLLMEKKRFEMIEAFLKLTPEERVAESEKRLDEVLEKMAQLYNISPGEAYEKLIENRNKIFGLSPKVDDQAKMIKVMR
ncbi:MAG: hypothetical protein SWH54_10195 [Thermodesulfobacteriota bacterium]|nr:hypothetical protein [Thermodesulfobacteriota bacterium]